MIGLHCRYTVIGGLIYVLIFGRQGWLGLSFHSGRCWPVIRSSILYDHQRCLGARHHPSHIFVTFLMARSRSLMQAQGLREEEAVTSVNGWQIFLVTLPKIKWANTA